MWTRLIAEYAEVSLDKALEIQDNIDTHFYFSECTMQEFHLAVDEAMEYLSILEDIR
jgi:hypothetical protein